ncbi:MAG: HAMP domain-containing histidine kinase [Chloroflexi bacterium]|nr:HAMP domain-containing histidine kinase [Chloroflexota bacterium]
MLKSSPIENQSSGSTWAALILAALLPVVCVVWFMTIAMRNERLAVQQRLTEVYQGHFAAVERQLTAFWRNRLAALNSTGHFPAPAAFAAIIRSPLADSVVIYDASGTAVYPGPSGWQPNRATEAPTAELASARELEFQKTNYTAAAEVYARMAQSSTNLHLRAAALQSQAGCLLKAGEKDRAIGLLTELTANAACADATSEQGALLMPNAQLLLLKLIHNPADVKFQTVAAVLAGRLNDYATAGFSASQRRFLMEEVTVLWPGGVHFPTLAAERLAAEYLEQDPPLPSDQKLQPAPLKNVWSVANADRTVVALFREDPLRPELESHLTDFALPGVKLHLLGPADKPSPTARTQSRPHPPLLRSDAGEFLPGWRLAMTFDGADPFEAASARQRRLYLWTGSGAVAVIVLVSLLAAHFVRAQVRLSRLKNELISTVTHELKTPLAGMRAIVDTLLANRYRDSAQLHSYLEMLSQETQRLSHLIDNFLSFSRMERNKQKFEFEPVALERVVQDALRALPDRFESPRCRLQVDLEPDLPTVQADRDAITTALINLLDNAHKYTLEQKEIAVHVFRDNGTVALQVTDNGIGLAPGEAARVFDRFYQADTSLSRRVGGCGLGLSIVQYIVKAHAGSVELQSEPGQGSTFTMRLPIPKEGA